MNDAARSSWPRSWQADASLPVRHYMQPGMRYVGLGMGADAVVQFMWGAGLTEVPVLDQQRRPVGLVSLGDLFASGRARAGDRGVLALLDADPANDLPRVQDIMVFGVATIHQSLPLARAAARMVQSERECLVVVDDDGVAVGSLAMPDIMRWLVEQTGAEVDEPVTPGPVRVRPPG
jgi:CBS-domain-containing membrane protein